MGQRRGAHTGRGAASDGPAAKVAQIMSNNINSAKIIFPYRYLWDRGIKPLSSYAELILVTLVAFF